jgi:hypothetical protein
MNIFDFKERIRVDDMLRLLLSLRSLQTALLEDKYLNQVDTAISVLSRSNEEYIPEEYVDDVMWLVSKFLFEIYAIN